MNWISGIQQAIDYVEAHLTEQVDYGETAKRACSSSFHFQRVFSILCGFTLGDYIRMRRLTLAGKELLGGDCKVIDIALKYGYDTPESFSRAFSRFHGITPSQAKSGHGSLKSFSRLSVKLIINGGSTMDYRIEKQGALRLVMKKKQVPERHEVISSEISSYWKTCTEDGTILALQTYMDKDSIFKGCMVGATFGRNRKEPDFPYGIGVVYNEMPVKESDFSIEEIPPQTYVVFTCKGQMPEAFEKLYHQAYSEFFPSSEYMPCGGTDFELYSSDNVSSPDYTCEIWLAVTKRQLYNKA